MKVTWIVNNPYVICIVRERIGSEDRQFKGKAKCNLYFGGDESNYVNDPAPENRDKFDEEKGKRIAFIRAMIKVNNAKVKMHNRDMAAIKKILAVIGETMDSIVQEQATTVAQIHSDQDILKKITV